MICLALFFTKFIPLPILFPPPHSFPSFSSISFLFFFPSPHSLSTMKHPLLTLPPPFPHFLLPHSSLFLLLSPFPSPFCFFLSFSGERSQDQSRNGCVKESSALGSCRHCTVVQNSHESRRQYWATCFSVCSFTSTAQTFACSALFASLARSAALIRSLARLLAHSRAHGRMDY